MSHAIRRVEHFEIVGPYRLRVGFDDNSEQEIDFRPILEGDVFRPLQDLSVFNAVALDREAGTLTWPNGADFDPTTLHDWPQVRDHFIAMARGWARHSTGVGRSAG